MVIPMVESQNHLQQRQGLVGISWVGPLFPVLQSWLTVLWLEIPETKHARILVVATGKGEEPKVYPHCLRVAKTYQCCRIFVHR